MNVLGIGYGRHVFDQANAEHRRLASCASAVDSFDQIIFTLRKHGCATVHGEHNFTVHPTNARFRISMLGAAVRRASKLVREKKIDVITTQDPFEAGLVGLLVKWRFPSLRLQVQEHGDVMSSKHWRAEKLSNQLRYRLGLFVLKRADIVRVVSERTKVFLASKLPESDIRTLPVVIDVTAFAALKKRTVRHATDTFTFLTAARFVPQKNLSLLIRAFAQAATANTKLRLRILGSGSQHSEIQQLVKQHNLTDVVTLAGWTDDLPAEMNQADAYVLSSNYEGWGRVLIEAMVIGLPAVSTDVGCVGEVFKDKEHGLVVPVGDEEALTKALVQLSTDGSLYTSIISNLQGITPASIPGTDVEAYAQAWAATMK